MKPGLSFLPRCHLSAIKPRHYLSVHRLFYVPTELAGAEKLP